MNMRANMNTTGAGQNGWTFPDGRQFTAYTLQQMGLTPGDLQYLMQDLYRNSGMMAHGIQKVGRTQEERAERANGNEFHQKQEAAEQRQEEQRRLETQRQTEQRQLEERQAEERWLEEKRIADAQAAKERPAEDALNWRIAMLPLGLAMFGAGVGLTQDAVEASGQALSPQIGGLSGPQMVTGTGGMLAAARNMFGMTGPGQDLLMTGPGAAVPFIPGQPLQTPTVPGATGPTQQQPWMIPGMSPTTGTA